eukprot:tig00000180_g13633.t1
MLEIREPTFTSRYRREAQFIIASLVLLMLRCKGVRCGKHVHAHCSGQFKSMLDMIDQYVTGCAMMRSRFDGGSSPSCTACRGRLREEIFRNLNLSAPPPAKRPRSPSPPAGPPAAADPASNHLKLRLKVGPDPGAPGPTPALDPAPAPAPARPPLRHRPAAGPALTQQPAPAAPAPSPAPARPAARPSAPVPSAPAPPARPRPVPAARPSAPVPSARPPPARPRPSPPPAPRPPSRPPRPPPPGTRRPGAHLPAADITTVIAARPARPGPARRPAPPPVPVAPAGRRPHHRRSTLPGGRRRTRPEAALDPDRAAPGRAPDAAVGAPHGAAGRRACIIRRMADSGR